MKGNYAQQLAEPKDNIDLFKMKTVHINEYGRVVNEEESTYTVKLTGSYTWSQLLHAYWHEVESIEPELQMSRLLSETLLV